MNRFKRKTIWILLLVIGLVFFASLLVTTKAKEALIGAFADKIVLLNQAQPFQINYESLEISFINKSFCLEQVNILPDELNTGTYEAQPHISINSIEGKNFKIFPLLWRQELNIDEFYIDGSEIVIKNEKRLKVKRNNPNVKSTRSLKKIAVEKFELTNYKFVQLNSNLKDTTTILTGDRISVEGIGFTRKQSQEENLELDLNNLNLVGTNHLLILKRQKDSIFMKHLKLDFGNGYINLEGFKYGNKEQLKSASKNNTFNKPLNAVHIPKMEFFGLKTDSLINNKMFIGDSILVKDAVLTIAKNLDKPWNTEIIKPLPQQMLRNQKNGFWFKKIQIENGHLDYIEFSKSDEILVPIKNLDAKITDVGTMKTNGKLKPNNGMKVQLHAILFDDLNFHLGMEFPNPLESNHFDFYGGTGPFRFESFNPIMVPTSNIMFESGRVDEINFKGQGNEVRTNGELVMRYSDLKAIVLKKNSKEKKKSFTWMANATIRKENPKNDKLKTAKMGYERIPYKGFGNYMFKTIESGLANSVYPLGSRKKN